MCVCVCTCVSMWVVCVGVFVLTLHFQGEACERDLSDEESSGLSERAGYWYFSVSVSINQTPGEDSTAQ